MYSTLLHSPVNHSVAIITPISHSASDIIAKGWLECDNNNKTSDEKCNRNWNWRRQGVTLPPITGDKDTMKLWKKPTATAKKMSQVTREM